SPGRDVRAGCRPAARARRLPDSGPFAMARRHQVGASRPRCRVRPIDPRAAVRTSGRPPDPGPPRTRPGAASRTLAKDRLGIPAVLFFVLAGVAPLTV